MHELLPDLSRRARTQKEVVEHLESQLETKVSEIISHEANGRFCTRFTARVHV
jgi:hypothetical protein